MCHRINPLTIQELKAAMDELRATGHARVGEPDEEAGLLDAYPGADVALLVPGASGLEVAELAWGFDAPAGTKSKLVFNTRIETALAQARSGSGLWARAIAQGRCLVPVRSFYESWTREPPRRGAQVRFRLPGHRVFLLAGVHEEGRFSVVTTTPNTSVAPLHSRMPLVLGPGESGIWLGDDYARLADRSRLVLDAEPLE